MRIGRIAHGVEDGVVRASAEITWEAVDRPAFTLFFETFAELRDATRADPNAFLLAALLVAWRDREPRVLVEGPLCPVLAINIRVALSTLVTWYPGLGMPPVIENTRGSEVRRPANAQAVSLLSCGVDSLWTLRWNRLTIPQDHPAAIRAALPVLFSKTQSPSHNELRDRLIKVLSVVTPVTQDVGVQVVPVNTNLWWLAGDDGYFYDEKWFGAVLSAIAYFLSRGYYKAHIGSGGHRVAHLRANGSHPMLDNYYSSSHFQIWHDGLDITRLEKTALVADWPVGLHNLQVCQRGAGWRGNCGNCEKCVRTMTALVALGKLGGSGAFPRADVSAELLASMGAYIATEGQAGWYRELVAPLKKRGRDDLLEAIERHILPAVRSKTSPPYRM